MSKSYPDLVEHAIVDIYAYHIIDVHHRYMFKVKPEIFL